jgi:hypothetical protein
MLLNKLQDNNYNNYVCIKCNKKKKKKRIHKGKVMINSINFHKFV